MLIRHDRDENVPRENRERKERQRGRKDVESYEGNTTKCTMVNLNFTFSRN